MSEYERMSVKDLRSLLQQRGLHTRGRKDDLIERLLENDRDTVLMSDQVPDNSSDGQVNVNAAQRDVSADNSKESHESEAVTILRLQIELEKIKLQQSQAGMAVGRDNSSVAADKVDLAAIKSRIPVMSADCDVIAYFMMYEKTLELNEVPRDLWAKILPSVLNEKAGKIFAQQPMECCRDYDKSRALLINAFKCSSDVYLRKLQTSTRTGTESYTMFLNRLAEYHAFYLQARKIVDFDALKDDVLMNFFMLSLKDNVVEFVKSRQPNNACEAAAAADLYYSVKSRPVAQERTTHLFRGKNQWVKQQQAGKALSPSETVVAVDAPTAVSAPAAKNQNKGEVSKPKACWSCGSLSHKRADCPALAKPSSTNAKRNVKAENSAFVASHSPRKADERFIFPCYIQGHEEVPCKAYRDSGASVSLISKCVVDERNYTGETISVRGIFGPEVQIPMAIVLIMSPKFSFDDYLELKAGVVDSELPFQVDVLIGNDLFGNANNCVDVLCVNDRHRERAAAAQHTRHSTLNSAIVCSDNNGNATSNTAVSSVSSTVTNSLSTRNPLCTSPETFGAKDCITVVTRSESSRAKSDRINDCDSNTVNNNAAQLYANEQQTSVTKEKPIVSPAVNTQQCVTHPGNRRSESLESTATSPQGVENRPSTHSPLVSKQSRPTSQLAETTRVSHPSENPAESPVISVNNADALLATEFARLAEIEPAALNTDNFDSYTAKQTELANLQLDDPKLQKAWKKAKEGKSGFVIKNGILFKTKPHHLRSDHDLLLVLPDSYEKRVLEAAHDSMTNGGHTGFQRTAEKILKTFYMPRGEIKQYCASCLICQRLRPKCVNERADYKIPLIDMDFGETFVIDIMGGRLNNLSRKYGGHKHVLVCVETATRWVELIPLPSLKAMALTTAIETNLIARFACKTLVYDQQSGFMSDLMQSVLKLLRVRSSVAIAGFHAKTAIAERYVRTVETYIKPYLDDYKGNWSLLLPWISFQLRQTPCALLKYSAHELVFGRNFPDKLEELRDEIEGNFQPKERKIKKNVVKYLQDLGERLRAARDSANKHANGQGARTKSWFDRNATPNKTFKPGDKCLVLESVDPCKMHSRWSEPVDVLRQIGHRSYEVKMNDGEVRVFHVNQLRRFNERTEFVNAVVVAADAAANYEDSYLPIRDDETSEPLNFNIEPSLPPDQFDRMRKLLTEFGDVFRSSLGKTNLATHKILLNDETPCVSRSYRIPEALKQPLEDELNRLLEAGVLRECSSEFRSPLIPIKKPDGSLRLVNAFQAINARTKDDLYPMANPLDILSKAAGKKYISKIDLSKAFLQIPLDAACQEYTAFSCTLGTLCWTRACLGLKNSPRTMQRLMDSLLRKTSKFAGCMIDDIVISSETFELHEQHVREILSRLRAANLTASLGKSEFLVKSMTVLGYCLEDGIIKPSQKHIEAILKIGPQTSKHGVRAILGMLNYHRNMIPSFAEITLCLTELLKKDQPERNIRWQQKHTEALNKIKQILTSNPILVPPNHERDYIIMSDATQFTIAAILAQKDEHGVERNVAYFSRKLLPNEINYSVVEKEALGILAACLKWHDWIYSHSVIARTDHRALAFLDSTAQHNARIARWKLILSNYNIITQYRKASSHGNCDALSRIEFSD